MQEVQLKRTDLLFGSIPSYVNIFGMEHNCKTMHYKNNN